MPSGANHTCLRPNDTCLSACLVQKPALRSHRRRGASGTEKADIPARPAHFWPISALPAGFGSAVPNRRRPKSAPVLPAYHTCLAAYHTCLTANHTCLTANHTCPSTNHTCREVITLLPSSRSVPLALRADGDRAGVAEPHRDHAAALAGHRAGTTRPASASSPADAPEIGRASTSRTTKGPWRFPRWTGSGTTRSPES